MERAAILIEPTGEVIGLHTEMIDLRELGRLKARRATTIEFNEVSQRWEVRELMGGNVCFSDPSRQACLDWEHKTFGRTRNLRNLRNDESRKL